MCFRYYKDHNRKDYYIPSCLEDRFDYLQQKIQRTNKEYIESIKGHEIEFENEFSRFSVVFKRGSVWKAKEECSDEELLVKILKVTDSVIYYKEIKKFWWFWITTGYKLNLNKWSFLRIFSEAKHEQ